MDHNVAQGPAVTLAWGPTPCAKRAAIYYVSSTARTIGESRCQSLCSYSRNVTVLPIANSQAFQYKTQGGRCLTHTSERFWAHSSSLSWFPKPIKDRRPFLCLLLVPTCSFLRKNPRLLRRSNRPELLAPFMTSLNVGVGLALCSCTSVFTIADTSCLGTKDKTKLFDYAF